MKKIAIVYIIFMSVLSGIAVTANNTDSCAYKQKKRQTYKEYSSKNYKGLKTLKIKMWVGIKIERGIKK